MSLAYLWLALIAAAPQPTTPTGPAPNIASIADEQAAEQGREEIIVEAPPTIRERRNELRHFASSLIRRPRAGRAIGSYFTAICPKVFGVPDNAARTIERLMIRNADSLGANRRNRKSLCRPNIYVVFQPPEEGPADSWLNYDSDVIRHLLSYQRLRVLNETDPVRSWQYSFLATAIGAPFATKIERPQPVEIAGSIIMIELEAALGKSFGQLADYASMRTFANTRPVDPGKVPAAPTILTLFQDDDPPTGLTTFDRALMSMIYDTSPSAWHNRFYHNIASRAVRFEQEEKSTAGGD